MQVRDFERSAEVSAVPMSDPQLGLGERMFRAVQATRDSVGCNTNLGIVLLCAPVAHAFLRGARPRTEVDRVPRPPELVGDRRALLTAAEHVLRDHARDGNGQTRRGREERRRRWQRSP